MSSKPLHGTELIDCAKANSKAGVEVAAERCGYQGDVSRFEQELRQAGEEIGVTINNLSDLRTPQDRGTMGVEIAPESRNQL